MQMFTKAKGTKTYAGSLKRVEKVISEVNALEKQVESETVGNYRWVITSREDGTYFPAVLMPRDKIHWTHNFIERHVGVMS